jgi:hypothetical protein
MEAVMRRWLRNHYDRAVQLRFPNGVKMWDSDPPNGTWVRPEHIVMTGWMAWWRSEYDVRAWSRWRALAFAKAGWNEIAHRIGREKWMIDWTVRVPKQDQLP